MGRVYALGAGAATPCGSCGKAAHVLEWCVRGRVHIKSSGGRRGLANSMTLDSTIFWRLVRFGTA